MQSYLQPDFLIDLNWFLIDEWAISQIEPSAHLPYKELWGGAVGE